MVKITIEYGSVEEAIQALGKMSGLAKVRRAAATAGVPQGATIPAPEVGNELAVPAATPATITKNLELPDTSRTRKGRSDKGKPRGPHKNAAPAVEERTDKADTLAPEAAPSTAAPAPAEADKAQPSGDVPAAAVPSQEDVTAATEALFAASGKSIQVVTDLMARYGVRKLRELKPEQRAAYIAEAKAATEKAGK